MHLHTNTHLRRLPVLLLLLLRSLLLWQALLSACTTPLLDRLRLCRLGISSARILVLPKLKRN